MNLSQAYQIVFDSEIPTGLPRPTASDAGEAQVRIKQATLAPVAGLVPWERVGSELRFTVDGVATFAVPNGEEILIDFQPEASPWEMYAHLRGTVMGGLLAQRGLISLHASAVDTPEGAVLLVGRAGMGKSTLAAALRRQELAVLCDEIAPLRLREGKVELVPDAPWLQLPGQLLRFWGTRPSSPPILQGIDRYRVWMALADQPTPPARPVRALIFLQMMESGGLELLALDKRSAFLRLIPHLYRWLWLQGLPGLEGPQGVRQSVLEALVEGASCWSLESPEGLDHLEGALERIQAMLATPPKPAADHWSQQYRLPKLHLHAPAFPPEPMRKNPGFLALASYPKSGNTWVRALLTAWHRETQTETDISGFEGGAPMLNSHDLEEEFGIKAAYLRKEDQLPLWRHRLHRHLVQYLLEPMPIKLHESCSCTPDGDLVFPPEVMVGVIFIVRCPLDVVPSYANHFSRTLEESVASMGAEGGWMHNPLIGSTHMLPQFMGSWSDHARSWLDEEDNRCLLVRYEDLLADTEGQLRRIIEFCGWEWDAHLGQKAVELCRFESLQAKEQERGFREKLRDAPVFFRQGRSGGWRTSLSPELARQVCLDHGEMMRRLGYGAEVDEVLAL